MFPSHSRRPAPRLVRVSAVVAPMLLLLYGALRLWDGADGAHGPGPAWNLGHAAFFVGFVFLGLLIVGLRRLLPGGGWPARAADVATVAGLLGVAAFLWVIGGDLVPDLPDLPGGFFVAGPVLFQIGLIALVVLLATVHPRVLPVWSPVLVAGGFVPMLVNLDLIPVGAVAFLLGLLPLWRRPSRDHPARGTATPGPVGRAGPG